MGKQLALRESQRLSAMCCGEAANHAGRYYLYSKKQK
jgi:hypothetical protein